MWPPFFWRGGSMSHHDAQTLVHECLHANKVVFFLPWTHPERLLGSKFGSTEDSHSEPKDATKNHIIQLGHVIE